MKYFMVYFIFHENIYEGNVVGTRNVRGKAKNILTNFSDTMLDYNTEYYFKPTNMWSYIGFLEPARIWGFVKYFPNLVTLLTCLTHSPRNGHVVIQHPRL